MERKELLSITSPMIDLLEGDEEVAQLLQNFDTLKLKKALDFITHNEKLSDTDKLRYISQSWRIFYRAEPPNHSNFISSRYLGPVADATYDRIKNAFLQFMQPSEKRNLILFQSIGFGKSFLSALITIFIAIHISLLRNPKRFFGQNPASILTQVLISFSLDKSSETLLEPIINILEASPYFEKVRTKEGMIKKEEEFKNLKEIDRIFWTTASPTSAITFSNGSNVKLLSSLQNLLGLTIVQGVLTELSFFLDAGKSPEYIMRLYNNLRERVDSRMKGNYFGRTILDSSPNNIESPIDNYCWYEAEGDPSNLVLKGGRFEWAPEDFLSATENFAVYLGGNGKPPEVLDSWEGIDPTTIRVYPKIQTVYQLFKNDTVNALKNIAGIPQGAMDRIFYNFSKIDAIFVPQMKNVYGYLTATELDRPEELLWNAIKDTFFLSTEKGYKFYYKPYLPRCISIDQSISGDATGIAMSHVEVYTNDSGQYEPIYVVDFSIPILPLGKRINLDAIKLFVCDLVLKGGMAIEKVTFDQFQSESSIQYIKRTLGEDKVEKLSVDREMGPYLSLIQLINQNRIRVGQNIILKNNLKSLRIVKRKHSETQKVDHTVGDTGDPLGNLDWNTSLIGYNAKDLSDAVAQSIEACRLYLSDKSSELFDENEIILTKEQKIERMKAFLDKNGMY